MMICCCAFVNIMRSDFEVVPIPHLWNGFSDFCASLFLFLGAYFFFSFFSFPSMHVYNLFIQCIRLRVHISVRHPFVGVRWRDVVRCVSSILRSFAGLVKWFSSQRQSTLHILYMYSLIHSSMRFVVQFIHYYRIVFTAHEGNRRALMAPQPS